MKKQLIIITVLLFASFCHAQQYHPFPVSNTMWTELAWPPDDFIHPWIPSFHCYGLLNKDTIINSKIYHKLYKSTDTIFDESEYFGAIREDSLRRIYYYGSLPDCFGNFPDRFKYRDILLYDFLVKVGDTIRNKYGDTLSVPYNLKEGQDWIVVESIDSIYLSGNFRKRINFEYDSNSWVEGIGNLKRGLLFTPGAVPNNGIWNRLICYKQNCNWLYHFSYFQDCFPFYLSNIIETKKNPNDVVVFPNPVRDISIIKVSNTNHQFLELEIISITGQIVKSSRFDKQMTYSINKNDFTNGIYLIKLTSKNGNTLSCKFIIE